MDNADLVATSGRETLSLRDRIDLLRAELLQPPLNALPGRSVTQAIHDLKILIAIVRSTIQLVDERIAAGVAWERMEPGASRFVAPIECQLLAWRRGGHVEWQRVRRAQRERGL